MLGAILHRRTGLLLKFMRLVACCQKGDLYYWLDDLAFFLAQKARLQGIVQIGRHIGPFGEIRHQD